MIKKNTLLVCLFSLVIKINALSLDLKLPTGFEINVFAEGLNSPRQITETRSGHIIVGSKKGNEVIALVKNNDATYKKVIVANELQNPAGVAFYEGDLYFAEMDTIWIIKMGSSC